MATSSENGTIDYGLPWNAQGEEDFMINDWSWSKVMDWSADNVVVQPEGGVILRLDESTDGFGAPYEGAAVQSRSVASEGAWSWIAQAPAMEDGAVFAMFLYRESHTLDPWLEYDFEFVGGDTTRVQLAVHMDDVNGNHIKNFGSVIIDLGFDASEEPHLYEIVVEGEATHFRIDGATVWEFSAKDMPGGGWLSGNMRSVTSLWSASDALVSWTGEWEYPGKPLEANVVAIGTPDHPIDQELVSMFQTKGDQVAGKDEGRMYCGGVRDQVVGGVGEDTLRGGTGDDHLSGGGGDDHISGGGGDDRVNGGAGNDILQGDEGSDTVTGGAGDDTFVFNAAANVGENDRYIGGPGVDTMVFEFTAAEWASTDLQNEMADYMAFVPAQTGPDGEASTDTFHLTKLGLKASSMEVVQIYIDDVIL